MLQTRHSTHNGKKQGNYGQTEAGKKSVPTRKGTAGPIMKFSNKIDKKAKKLKGMQKLGQFKSKKI